MGLWNNFQCAFLSHSEASALDASISHTIQSVEDELSVLLDQMYGDSSGAASLGDSEDFDAFMKSGASTLDKIVLSTADEVDSSQVGRKRPLSAQDASSTDQTTEKKTCTEEIEGDKVMALLILTEDRKHYIPFFSSLISCVALCH